MYVMLLGQNFHPLDLGYNLLAKDDSSFVSLELKKMGTSIFYSCYAHMSAMTGCYIHA